MLNVTKRLKNLKGNDTYETVENYSILGLVVGCITLSAGIGLTVLSPQGIPAVISMLGALVAFCSTVTLILSWFGKEVFKSD